MCPVTMAALGLGTASAAGGAAATGITFGSIASTVGTVASIGSTILGLVGSHQQASAEKRAAEFRAEVQGELRRLGERGRLETQKREDAARALAGKQKAAQAANGVSFTGSALRQTQDDFEEGTEDVLETRENARREATRHATGAQLDSMHANSINPTFNAVGAALDGAARVSSRWDYMREDDGVGTERIDEDIF